MGENVSWKYSLTLPPPFHFSGSQGEGIIGEGDGGGCSNSDVADVAMRILFYGVP